MALSAIIKQKAEQGQPLGLDVIAIDKLIDISVETAWEDRCLTSPLVSSGHNKISSNPLTFITSDELFECEIDAPPATQEEKRSFYYGIPPERHAIYVLKAFFKLVSA